MIRSERLANLIESFPLGILVIDSDHHIVEANKTAATLLGVPPPVKTPISLLDMVHPEDRGTMLVQLEALSRGKKTKFQHHCRLVQPMHRNRWFRLMALRTEGPGNSHTQYVIFEDATAEVEKQEELRREKEVAQTESQIQGDFLANVSHEIRTPLHTVSSLVDLLQDTSLNDEQLEYVDQISLAGDILLGLINNLLDYARINAGRLKPERKIIDVRHTVTEAVRLISYEAHRKGLEVVLSVSHHVPEQLIGDAPRIRQVLVNFLNNATKYTERGTITVDVRPRRGSVTQELLVQVRDTGLGIDEESQKKLFQRYSQIRHNQERATMGTGLGLSICRDLVSLMGGSIGVMSKPGVGSNFWFSLPIILPPSKDLLPTHRPQPQNIDSSMRVLLVEDNRTSAKVMQDIFTSWNIELVITASGAAALQVLKKPPKDQSFALAIIDQKLSDMDGWQLASEIRHDEQNHALPLILISPLGLTTGEAKMKLLQWFNGYLPKPFTLEEVVRAIDHVFTEGVEELSPVASEVGHDHSASLPLFCTRALVVEDHSVNRELLVVLLQRMGCEAVTASCGEDAIEVATRKKDLEIIFMDIRMPGMDGYEATRRLRSMGITIPVIAVTANGHREVVQKCHDAGMNSILTKPFKSDDVRRVVAEQIQPPWDSAAALETFMGDATVLQRVMSQFCARLPVQIHELKGFISTKNWEDAGILAHGIKGSAWNLSCPILGERARSIEHSCHGHEPFPMEEDINQLEEEAKRVISYAKTTAFWTAAEDDPE